MNRNCLLFLVVLAVAGMVSGVSASQIVIDSVTIDQGDTATIAFTLDEAPNGLSACIFTVSLDTPGIAEITAVSFPAWAEMTQSDFTGPAQSVKMKFGDLSYPVDYGSGATNVPLGSVVIEGIGPGTSAVTLTIQEPVGFADKDDAQFRPAIVNGQVTVNALTGSLEVTSTPDGASIWIDGSDTGEVTPFTFPALSAGEHTVIVQKAGYYSVARVVTVVADSTVSEDFTLTPQTGSLAVTSTPAGAAIWMNGADSGQVTPYTFSGLAAGSTQSVVVKLAGYVEPAPMDVVIVVDSTVTADFTLVQQTGSLAVTSTPAGAAIWMNGADSGQVTPYTFGGLAAGSTQTVVVKLAGYVEPAPMDVVIVVDSTVTADFTLVQQTGSLAVTSTPAGAAIWLNGADSGQVTPYTFGGLAAGSTQSVVVKLAGYMEPAPQTPVIVADSTVSADFTLVQQTGSLAVTSTPAGAAIWMNGADSGQVTPYTFRGLAAGSTQSVVVRLAGYVEPAPMDVVIVVDSTVTADFTLVQQTGSLAVTSTPAGAAIWMNGADSGQVTPYTFGGLAAGSTQSVVVKLAGYVEPAPQTPVIVADSTVTADFTLTQQTGSLAVTSTPAGAAIWMNGADSGQVTPYTFSGLAAGSTQTVVVKLAGYVEPAPQSVVIVADSTVSADFTLTQQTGSLAVTSTPAGAAIWMNGADSGEVTPFTFSGLAAGSTQSVVVKLAGYVEPAPQSVVIVADSTVSADFTLTQQTGSLAVTSTPAGAAIWMNGADSGQVTPYTFSGLAAGSTQSVVVKLAGYVEPAPQSVVIVADSTVTADFTLTQQTGSLAVTSTPAGAAIWMNGADSGEVTPYTFTGLAAGSTQSVVVKLAGYVEPAPQSVVIVADSTVSADFTLTQQTGSLAVTSTPAGAAIWMNGADSGEVTPYTFTGLAAGSTQSVVVKLAGYVEPSPQSVVIVADSTVSADFTLTQIPPQPVLTTIVVTPAVKIVQTGATQQFTATGYDQFGQVMPCSGIVWTSSDETVGTIDTNGLFEALTEGSVVITATCDNVAGSADVTVCNEPPAVPEFPTLLVPLGIIGAILMVSMVFRRD